jgi:hypothetical protein
MVRQGLSGRIIYAPQVSRKRVPESTVTYATVVVSQCHGIASRTIKGGVSYRCGSLAAMFPSCMDNTRAKLGKAVQYTVARACTNE